MNPNDSEQILFPDKSLLNSSSIRDFREIASMPELCRTTLMDQIDYSLDNYKINESSMSNGSLDQSKFSIPKQQFMRAEALRTMVEDVQPKFMKFLNKENTPIMVQNGIRMDNRTSHNFSLPEASKKCSQAVREKMQQESSKKARKQLKKARLQTEKHSIKVGKPLLLIL